MFLKGCVAHICGVKCFFCIGEEVKSLKQLHKMENKENTVSKLSFSSEDRIASVTKRDLHELVHCRLLLLVQEQKSKFE